MVAPHGSGGHVKSLRVALCQLESHPAVYASHIAYLEEPILPNAADASLSTLAAKGLDVSAAQEQLLREYTEWQRTRIASVLSYLDACSPVPHRGIFTEGLITRA